MVALTALLNPPLAMVKGPRTVIALLHMRGAATHYVDSRFHRSTVRLYIMYLSSSCLVTDVR
jgi:hypothetical protein